MEQVKPVFLDFCAEAERNGTELHMDCGRIPKCYFSEEEWETVQKALPDGEKGYDINICSPILNIDADLRVYSCLIASDNKDSATLDDFDTPEELQRYLYMKYTAPMYQNSACGRCKTCKKHELVKCQGGCLAFGNG